MIRLICSLFLILHIYGCASTPRIRVELKKVEEFDKDTKIRNEMLKVFNEDKAIILAYEKTFKDTFDIIKCFHQYKKTDKTPTYDEFWIWLDKNHWGVHLWEKGDKWGIAQKILDMRFKNNNYIDMKRNYDLFKEKLEGL